MFNLEEELKKLPDKPECILFTINTTQLYMSARLRY